MTEVITVEVAGKFGPKANGKWYGVKRPLKSTDFKQGSTYEVQTEEWNSNGKSGVNIISFEMLDNQPVKRSYTKKTVNSYLPLPFSGAVSHNTSSTIAVDNGEYDEEAIVKAKKEMTYDDKKNTRILRQGVVQAVIQSPMLAGLPFTSANEAVELVKEVANALIAFVEEQ